VLQGPKPIRGGQRRSVTGSGGRNLQSNAQPASKQSPVLTARCQSVNKINKPSCPRNIPTTQGSSVTKPGPQAANTGTQGGRGPTRGIQAPGTCSSPPPTTHRSAIGPALLAAHRSTTPEPRGTGAATAGAASGSARASMAAHGGASRPSETSRRSVPGPPTTPPPPPPRSWVQSVTVDGPVIRNFSVSGTTVVALSL